jgi:hypothetical protein
MLEANLFASCATWTRLKIMSRISTEFFQLTLLSPMITKAMNERTAIRQLLKFAKRRGYITDVPEFAIQSGRIHARPDIPETEWQRLVRFLPGMPIFPRRRRERFYLVL